MLSDVWRVLKASFNKRLCLYYSVVTCFTMLGSIPIILFKLVFLAALIPTASLFLMIFGKNFLYPTFKIIWLSWKAPRLPVPDQLKQLARRMNTPLEEIKIINIEEKNAFATGKCIVFTRGLLNALDKGEILSVAAHELARHKGKAHNLQICRDNGSDKCNYGRVVKIYFPNFFERNNHSNLPANNVRHCNVGISIPGNDTCELARRT